MSNARTVAAAALVGLCASLLTVGLVSTPPTFWRHVVQIIPAVAVLMMVLGNVRGWAFAAGAIFLFWLLIVIAIWLFLLGAARIVSGTFSPAEIILTRDIALCSLAGLVAVARCVRGTGWLQGIAICVIVAATQYGAMWLSQQPAFRQTTPIRGRASLAPSIAQVPDQPSRGTRIRPWHGPLANQSPRRDNLLAIVPDTILSDDHRAAGFHRHCL